MTFRTHTGEIVKGKRLEAALRKVANDWRRLARAIRKEDRYASHVSSFTKNCEMWAMLNRADKIEAGAIESFTIWQRVNEALTGDCVALLPK